MADPRFNDIFTHPENEIFHVVFFPDRIYHAQYLNATRSPRYRYNVQEVRGKLDVNVLKGEIYLDGRFFSNFLRVEYHASRLVEQARIRNRFVREELMAYINLLPENQPSADATVKLIYCPWVDAYQVEIWETLEAPANTSHDFKVLDMMGYQGSITRIPPFGPALRDIKKLKRLELAFRENDRNLPFGFAIDNPGWDNNFRRSFQVPNTQTPNAPQNTIEVLNYLIDFQRGWYLHSDQIDPVRYLNAMMNEDDPERAGDNVIEMRWLLQRELGGSLVFFHEVTVPPGRVEGTHQHIGSEELYYITQGEGIAYMGLDDDPQTAAFPKVTRNLFGIGLEECRELPVKAGSVIFTKSGGVHGIRNSGMQPLKFVAFLYHSS